MAKKSNWLPPKNCGNYFFPSSDDDFKAKHPIGYFFLVILGMIALLLPFCIYCIYAVLVLKSDSPWMLLGGLGAFIIGIGLFNYVAIIIKQFLGHLLSIVTFALGAILILISLLLF